MLHKDAGEGSASAKACLVHTSFLYMMHHSVTFESPPVLHQDASEGGVQQRCQGARRQHQARRVGQHAADQQEGIVRQLRVLVRS